MKLFGWWFKGNQIKQPPIKVETEPRIRSITINNETYLHYGDVIKFMMDEEVNRDLRWALDEAIYFK